MTNEQAVALLTGNPALARVVRSLTDTDLEQFIAAASKSCIPRDEAAPAAPAPEG